jgi:cell division septation protein DedD
MVVGPPASPEFDRPIPEDRRAIARDVAAVVTPGLAIRDVPALPALRSPAPPQRSAALAPRPAVARPSTASPAAGPTHGTAEVVRPARMTDEARDGVMTVALPAGPLERSPAPEPAVARAPAAPPGYWIQVGAYRNATLAGRVAERVKGELLIAPAPAASDPLLRVRVGPFSSRAQAIARLGAYRSLGYKPFVVAD